MNKQLKAAAVVFTILCISFIFTSCSQKKQNNILSQKAQSAASINVYITIDYPEEANLPDIVNHKFPLDDNPSLLTSIELFGILLDIPILVETTSGTVIGINGVTESTLEGGTWIPILNDEELARPYFMETLADGDTIKWVYNVPEKTEESQN